MAAWPDTATGIYGVCYACMGQDFYEIKNRDLSTQTYVYNITSDSWSETSGARTFSHVINMRGGSAMAFRYDSPLIYQFGTQASPLHSYAGTAYDQVFDFTLAPSMSRTFNAGLRFELEVKPASSGNYTLSATLQKSDDGGYSFDSGITITESVVQSGTSGQLVILQTPPLGSFKAGRVYR